MEGYGASSAVRRDNSLAHIELMLNHGLIRNCQSPWTEISVVMAATEAEESARCLCAARNSKFK